MAYLLDSDILIDLSRGNVPASEYVDGLGEWSVSVVTGMELIAGAKDKNEVREIDLMLAAYRTIPLSEEVGQLAYNLMKSYSKSDGLRTRGRVDRRNRYPRRAEARHSQQKALRRDRRIGDRSSGLQGLTGIATPIRA